MRMIKILLFVVSFGLTGCSTIVSEFISGQQSFGYEHLASRDGLKKLGFSKSRFCLQDNQTCMSYLTAEPLPDKQKLNYEVTIGVSGNEETIQLKLKRENAAIYHGEVVLIHGFRATKEFMINSALYFRFLGFKVLIPDLLGHGESSGDIGFGIKDSHVLDELLAQRPSNKLPVLVVGNSMGSIAAIHLAAKNGRISGLILQAPMIKFDSAAVNYINSYSPFIASFLSDRVIREGSVKALKKGNVSLSQTDIKPILSSLKISTLLLASDNDPVAPFSYFKPTQSQKVTVVNIEKRSHPGMAVIGNLDDKKIQQWLSSKANKAFQRTSR